MKKLLFIINPKAGVKKHKNFVNEAVEIFQKSGYNVGVKFTRKRGDGTSIAEKYGAKADLIVCMGGDGTLNEVMQGISEGKVETPLGYIPAGSTNDFATSLGLSNKPSEAAEFIMNHQAKPLDLGSFNGRFFVYTAAAGIFTKASYDTPQKLKNRLGHFAYILTGLKELFQIKKLHMTIQLEEEVIENTYIFAAINNATKIGGIMKLDKDLVQFNDGVFELMLVEYPKTPIDFWKMVIKILRQRFTGEIVLKQIENANITVDNDINWSLDGEKEKGERSIQFRVIHDAINFIY